MAPFRPEGLSKGFLISEEADSNKLLVPRVPVGPVAMNGFEVTRVGSTFIPIKPVEPVLCVANGFGRVPFIELSR